MHRFILLSICLLTYSSLAGVPPAINIAVIQLVDGSSYEVEILGTRSAPYLRLMDDGRYLVEEEGTYYVAQLVDHHDVISTGEIFGQSASYNASTGERIPQVRQQAVSTQAMVPTRIPYRYGGGRHEQPLVVVRVAFLDQGFKYSDAEISERIFGTQDSVAAYFREASSQQFRIVPAAESNGIAGDGIVRLTLPSIHPNFGSLYGASSRALVTAALLELNTKLNLSSYDRNGDSWLDPSELGVIVLAAGFEQAYASSATTHPRVWAHKSSVPAVNIGGTWITEYTMFGEQHEDHLATIGLMAHELGHLLFDLPDLYDSVGLGESIGRWGLMSYGIWNSGGGKAGDKPAHMIGWSRELLGFTESVTDMGDIFLDSADQGGEVLRIDLDKYRHGKRLIVENRAPHGYDSGLPSSGLMITEIDDWRGFGALSGLTVRHSERLVVAESAHQGTAISTDGSGIMIDAADTVSLADGKVVLSSVLSGDTAQLSVSSTVTPNGFAFGYDELPANATWGDYGSDGYALIAIPVTEEMRSVDGIDFFAHGIGQVEFAIYSNASRYSGEGRLALKIGSVQEGWNRLLLDRPLDVSLNTVYLQIISKPSGQHAPFLADTQGEASGRTQIKERLYDAFYDANFDLSVKVLVGSSGLPSERVPRITDSSNSSTSSQSTSSSSGGGAVSWLFVFLAILLVRFRHKR